MKIDILLDSMKQEIPVSQKVANRVTDSLVFLPDRESRKEKKKHKAGILVKSLGTVAAAFLILTLVCIANPAFAAKLPLIGHVFAQIQRETTYRGDFDNKADTLAVIETSQNSETSAALIPQSVEGIYTAEDSGIKITATEIYSDGMMVFISAQVDYSINGTNLLNIGEHYTSYNTHPEFPMSDEEVTLAQGIYTQGQWQTEDGEFGWLDNLNFEGKAISETSFIGMLVVPLNDFRATGGVLTITFDKMGYDSKDEIIDVNSGEEDKFVSGSWTLELPFNVDIENSKMHNVEEYTEDGSGIEKIFVSPYEVVVFNKINTYTREDNEETQAEYNKTYGEGNEKGIPVGEYSYEEFLNEILYEGTEYYAEIYDQDGVPLHPLGGDMLKQKFSTQNREITEIYVFADKNSRNIWSANTLEDARAVAEIEIHLEIK